MTRNPLFLASFALCILALAGCSEVQLALHVFKRINLLDTPETEPLPEEAEDDGYKLGEPYEIDHVWYFPNYEANYDRVGIASWYGHAFHGRPTANGERYDMNEVTAAHPTLPLPSRVRVTNLENGRELVVRVNDRGPFIDGRIIDVSRRAAQLLGFYREGLAEVRVEYLGLDHVDPDVPWPADSPPKIAHVNGTPTDAVTLQPIDAVTLQKPVSAAEGVVLPPSKPLRTAKAPAAPDGGERINGADRSRSFMVEAAVLNGRDAADRLGAIVSALGAVAVQPERRGERMVYAVRIGPVESNDEAAIILAQLNRVGLTDSRIIAAGYR